MLGSANVSDEATTTPKWKARHAAFKCIPRLTCTHTSTTRAATISSLVQPDVCEKPFLPNIFYFAVEQFEIKKIAKLHRIFRKKTRQIEGRSALLSSTVNKLSRIFVFSDILENFLLNS